MFEHYIMTQIEEFQESLYRRIGVSHPSHLTIEEMAARLNVWLYFGPVGSKALEVRPGMYSVNIDSRLNQQEQWLDFLHELCHLLRHAGDQSIMPEQFTRAQECEANAFMLYAALPLSMIQRLHLPASFDGCVEMLANEFRVPVDLATQRMEQIQRRCLQGMFQKIASTYRPPRAPVESHNGHTEVYAYFDPYGDLDEPSQLIVSIDQQDARKDELLIPIDGPYKRINPESPPVMSCVQVGPEDIACRNGHIFLKIKRLAERHGLSARNVLLQMRDIEEAKKFAW
ncbi:ImmA/IrrE family metallo-endopeptidase [Paenibacillus thiaminolyticus]|uniref:ImmA/IrrE family metallo-endopeptidase n=1 Tax=Paenibacillus thiaminolyticus TaxID=49283 RepID=A0A3A3GQJ7_PANTH|nr:ImmA/IrrE family metallo-endopeptidase [Paenibacillus thiaminolyticus]RJG26662.1 ImmA/IrrE family metallo-endopeptidase [Paenibacillus thiaminolyticus]